MRSLKLLLFTAFSLIISITAYAQPANNNCASATALVVDDPCVSGDTENATLEAGENAPSCDATQTQSTWYTFTATSGNMQVNVDASSASCFATSVVYDGSTCQPGTELSCSDNAAGNIMIHNLSGLVTTSNTYLVQVSYGDGGPCGMGAPYCVGVNDLGSGSCTANEECASAQSISITSNSNTCTVGCNTGATVGPTLTGGCNDFTNETVWYTFTTPATDVYLDLSVTSGDLSEPQITLFTSCGTFLGTSCVSGTGGSASLTSYSITPSTQYWVAVSDATGDVGSFNLCMRTYPDTRACNIASELTWIPDTIAGGGWEPGTTVNFCYTIDTFANIGLQYIQGIVPTFGDGWEAFNPATDITLAPTCAACVGGSGDENGTWTWMNSGVTVNFDLYNLSSGDDVGAGWFFASDNPIVSNTDPNNSWGDGCLTYSSMFGGSCSANAVDGQNLSWTMCFNLTTVDEPTCLSGLQDLSVSIRTYSDGQIGNYSNSGCNGDLAFTNFSTASCISLPINLLSFTGNHQKNGNYLVWKTENAEGVYVLQRSSDGQVFSDIARVPANDATTEYTYLDQDHFEENIAYYRLKYMKDGSEEYSSTLKINNIVEFSLESIYPNPFKNNLYLQFKSFEERELNVKISDLQGLTLIDKNIKVEVGNSIQQLNLEKEVAEKGVLFLMITDEKGKVYRRKIVNQ